MELIGMGHEPCIPYRRVLWVRARGKFRARSRVGFRARVRVRVRLGFDLCSG